MRRVKVPGLDIEIPPGSAFKIETPPMMPKMHLLAAVVAPRGYGKGVITTNLIEQSKVVDRLILVSPSAASNKALNDRLKRILAKEDMFDNPNDISVLDKIVAIVEKERDDYEDYWEKRRKYELLVKKLDSDMPFRGHEQKRQKCVQRTRNCGKERELVNAHLEENRRLREESIQREHAERFRSKEDTAAEVEQQEVSVANDTEEEVVYQKKPKRKRRMVVVQDSSSEEEIEVKLSKQKKGGTDGNDEVYRRAYQLMFELH